jgi:hypothetical protein
MKLPFRADQFCWDIHITAHGHNRRAPPIDMFVLFLDEQLAFFLVCQSDCSKVGSALRVTTRDDGETGIEYFMSDDQIRMALEIWWKDRNRFEFFNSIIEYSVLRPAIHFKATKKYSVSINALSSPPSKLINWIKIRYYRNHGLLSMFLA